MPGLIGLTKIGPQIIDDDDDANLGVESNMWRRMRPQLTQPSSWAVAWSCSHRKRYFPIQHFSEIFYNLVGMVLLEVKYMKRSKAKIVKRKSMKREMVQVCLTKHQLARQKQRQKLNKPPISHDQITSLLSLSNNPDLFLETLSPLFASDFVALITNQRWMFRTEKNISEIFDRKTPVRIQKLKTAEGEKCKMSKFS